jgi:hypothetical protein
MADGRWGVVGYRLFQSQDGDTIDCVAAHEQHGLDHPLLRAHAVQTEPPEAPRGGAALSFPAGSATSGSGAGKDSRRGAWQTWHHGGHCPRGTVAIRRTSAEDVLRAGSISRFGRKRRHRKAAAARAAYAPDVITGNGHEVS